MLQALDKLEAQAQTQRLQGGDGDDPMGDSEPFLSSPISSLQDLPMTPEGERTQLATPFTTQGQSQSLTQEDASSVSMQVDEDHAIHAMGDSKWCIMYHLFVFDTLKTTRPSAELQVHLV